MSSRSVVVVAPQARGSDQHPAQLVEYAGRLYAELTELDTAAEAASRALATAANNGLRIANSNRDLHTKIDALSKTVCSDREELRDVEGERAAVEARVKQLRKALGEATDTVADMRGAIALRAKLVARAEAEAREEAARSRAVAADLRKQLKSVERATTAPPLHVDLRRTPPPLPPPSSPAVSRVAQVSAPAIAAVSRVSPRSYANLHNNKKAEKRMT